MARLSLSFFGAAREVTGSCFLLDDGTTKLLIDCGMFQGCDDCDLRTHEPFSFNPKEVSALLVTHAHIDHIGRIPKLIREGFSSSIFTTPPTADLIPIMLEDAMNFFSEENPLFSKEDLDRAVGLIRPTEYNHSFDVGPYHITFVTAGHILGSSFIRVEVGGKVILFSGDVGNEPSTLLPPPADVTDANVLILESTYGNRVHRHTVDRRIMLERAIEDVAARRGVLLMPTFASERTQEILFEINEMIVEKRVPPMPIFVDSPLAIKITDVFSRYTPYYRSEIKLLQREHPNLFRFKNLTFTPSVAESKGINNVRAPKVIIAGSGMSTGGRILHHEKRHLGDPASILLITGYQAPGSLGRRLLDRASSVQIHNEMVPVHAEVRLIDGYSAHADEPQLRHFVEGMRDTLERVFMVHGEADASLSLQQTIRDHLGIRADTPFYGQRIEL